MEKVVGAVFVGGKSSRFCKQDKSLAVLGDKPLLQHVIERLQPQVDSLILSTHQKPPTDPVAHLSITWVSDAQSGQHGPMMALYSCLRHIQSTENTWLLIAACDTPFLPHDLFATLHACAAAESAQICVPIHRGRLQPASSLWHRDSFHAVEEAVINNGVKGFHEFFDSNPISTLSWPDVSNAFMNLNTPEDLAAAEVTLMNQ